jgi:hypothetical protein
MRSTMLAILAATLTCAGVAQASDSAIGNETATADQAQDKAETDTADEAKEPEEFKVPAGYRAKKRGKKTVYCKKDMESGTRFAQERCFDEAQLRQQKIEREQEKASLDQSRLVCATPESCAGN